MSESRQAIEVPDDWFSTPDSTGAPPSSETRETGTMPHYQSSRQAAGGGVDKWMTRFRPNERTRLLGLIGLLLLLPIGFAYLRDFLFVSNYFSGYVDDRTLLPEVFSTLLTTVYGLVAGSLVLNRWRKQERLVLVVGAIASLALWQFFVAPSDYRYRMGSTSQLMFTVLLTVGIVILVVMTCRVWLDRVGELLRVDRQRGHRQYLVAAAVLLGSYCLVRYKIAYGGFGFIGFQGLSWPWLMIPLTILNLMPGMILVRSNESIATRLIWAIALISWWAALYAFFSSGPQPDVMYAFVVPSAFAVIWFLVIGTLFTGLRIESRPLGKDYGWGLAALWSLPLWLVLVGGFWIHHKYDTCYLITSGLFRKGWDWERASELRVWSRFSEVEFRNNFLRVQFHKGVPQNAIEFPSETQLMAVDQMLIGISRELDLANFPLRSATNLMIIGSQITIDQLAALNARILNFRDVTLDLAETNPATPQLEFTRLYLFENCNIDLSRLLSHHKDVSKISFINAFIANLSQKDLETLLNLPNVAVQLNGTEDEFARIWNGGDGIESCWLTATNPSVRLCVRDSQFPFYSTGKAWLTFALWAKPSVSFDSIVSSRLPDLNQPAEREIVMDALFLGTKLVGRWFESNHVSDVRDKKEVFLSSHWLYGDDHPLSASYLYLPDMNFEDFIDQEQRAKLQALSLRSDWNLLSPGVAYDYPNIDTIRLWIRQGPFPQLKELYLPEMRGSLMQLIEDDSSFFVDHFPNLEVVDFEASLFFDGSQSRMKFAQLFLDQLVQLKRLRRVVVRNPLDFAFWKAMASSLPSIEEVGIVSDIYQEMDINEIQKMFPNATVQRFEPDSIDVIPEHYRRHYMRTIEKLKQKYPLPLANPPTK